MDPKIRYSFWIAALFLSLTCRATGDEVRATDWPQFRGAGGAGVADGRPALTDWDVAEGRGVLWKTPVAGLAHSSPILWGDQVFVTTAVPKDLEPSLKVGLYGAGDSAEDMVEHEWKLMCLDRRSGRVVWERTACAGVPKVKRHTKATHCNSTPATDGRVVIAWFGSEGLFAYTTDGSLLWKKELGVLDVGPHDAPELQWGFASSPILHEGRVYLQGDIKKDPFLIALDASDGREIWRVARDDVPGWCTPAIAAGADGVQVVVNGCKHMGGYDAQTGKEVWRMSGGGGIPVPMPVLTEDLILLTSNHQPINEAGPQQPIFAVRRKARGDVTIPKDHKTGEFVAWSLHGRGNYMQTPLVYRGLAYFCKDNGIASCYDVNTGEKKWRERLGGGQSGFTASPIAVEGTVYWTSEDGDVYAVDAGGEFKTPVVHSLAEVCLATPAASRGVLYFRTRGHVVAIGAPAE